MEALARALDVGLFRQSGARRDDRPARRKVAVTGRGNPATGKGSAEGFVSYPLVRIDGRLPHLYLFSQLFTGYGEALVDYNRNVSHARSASR